MPRMTTGDTVDAVLEDGTLRKSVHGYVIVCYPGSEPPHVDTYSGGYGDIYTTREEAEDILYLTRSCMSRDRPLDHYELAELHIIPIREGDERRAVPTDSWYEG